MGKTIRKVSLVTGGGSGLGFAIAEKFTQNKIHTIIVGRDAKKLDNAKKQLGEYCHAIPGDLSKLSSIPSLVGKVIQQFGRIDILVNAAGIHLKKELTAVTDEEFQQVLTTNLCAVFSISREVGKQMLTAGKGCIINISSMSAHYGMPKVIAYTASKAAIEGMTRAMAVELSPFGIRVNTIAPGFIHTAMTAQALDSEPLRKAKVIGRTPMGYMGQPSDIGHVAAFLASDAAKYITGIVLPVDGGNSIGF